MNRIDPEYYKGDVECIDAIQAAIGSGTGFRAFLQGQVMKYVWRYQHKNGIEDLEKAEWYLHRLKSECMKLEEEK